MSYSPLLFGGKIFSPVQFSYSVMSDTLQPHGLQHDKFPCPSPTPGACSTIESVMPSNRLILCRHFLLWPSIFPSLRVFSNESILHIRWPKYWSFTFSISLSNEYSGLISFRIELLGSPCSPRDSHEYSPIPQFKKINSLALSLFYGPTLTSIHGYWKKTQP